MNSMFKSTVLAASVAAAMGFASAANAGTGILFDPTGTSQGGVPVDTFTWTNNYVLSRATFPSSDGDGVLMGFGSFSSATYGGNGAGGFPFRFSYQFSVPVTMSQVGSTVRWTTNGTGAENYFRMYYDTTPSYQTLAGTGFGLSNAEVNPNMSLILDGKVSLGTNPITGLASSQYTPTDLVNFVDLGTQAAGNTPNIISVTGTGSVVFNVNVCRGDEVGAALTPECTAVSTVNQAFFRSDVDRLQIDMDMNQGISTPIPVVNASGAGTGNVPSLVNNIAPYYGGTVAGQRQNDFDCEAAPGPSGCDMIYAGQAGIMRFQNEFVPEPGSIALLGLGLGALGVLRRRRVTA